MTINIDPKGLEHVNTTAAGLLLKLVRMPPQEQKASAPTASSVHLSAKTIDLSDVKDMVLRSVDNFGVVHAHYFQTPDGMLGLNSEAMKEAIRLVEDLAKRKELSEFVTKDYLLDNLFLWFKEKYIGILDADKEYGIFLLDSLSSDVKQRSLAFPLSFIHIVKPLTCGNIKLSYYDQVFFEQYKSKLLEEHEQPAEEIENYIRSLQKKYQGKVVAIISKTGVRDKCIELARIEIVEFLQILRFYSPSSLIPDIPSYFNTMGNDFVQESHILLFDDDRPQIIDGLEIESYPDWNIDSEQLKYLEISSFWKAIGIYEKVNKTELELLWFRAVKIFNKAVVKRDYHIKYVFLFSALESLFIADGGEPILKSLAQRIAIFTKSDIDNRLQLIENFKEAYQRRSRFLHHGSMRKDDPIIRDFQLHAWNAIYHVLLNLERFKTKDEFISILDRRLLQ